MAARRQQQIERAVDQIEHPRRRAGRLAGVAAAIDTVMARYESIDVLVNVAGQMLYKPVAELTGECFRRMRSGGMCAAVSALGGLLFVLRCLPETKGKTLEEIERDWR